MRSCLAPVTVEPTRSTNAASLIPNSFSSSRNAGRPARPGLSPMRTRLPAFNASATLQSPGLTISVREKKGRQWDNSPRCGGVGAYRLAIAFPVLGSYIISAATTKSAEGNGVSKSHKSKCWQLNIESMSGMEFKCLAAYWSSWRGICS